ncbi:uncharacterized protein LOC130613425 [Hydractinia symbiolongicarpus]|uniref:uncharacterized protein LOC130613424 n=1 Tax=Hydractinia symbiolongicarpus TaxID=13093 RepID=UPI00254F540D|nr:uncharacterized protein LOC130613424 [Hydractinia symbiolongicarpus]XP_057290754.1 uncharacterized protein LOC130613425 [Hydractinia symbiolongicarpus]
MITFLAGLDYNIIMSTFVFYLKDLVKTDRPHLCYAILLGVFSVSATLTGGFGGRYVDRTRNLKIYTNAVLALILIGNLLYSVYLHPAFLIIGRLLAGVGDPFMSVCAGELVRLYSREEATSAIWVMTTAYAMGFTVGPAFGIIFKGVNFKIGSFIVTYLNFIGIFVAGVTFVTLVMSNMLLPNKLLELKDLVKNMPEKSSKIANCDTDKKGLTRDEIVAPKENNNHVETLPTKQVFSNCIAMYSSFSLDMLFPLLVDDILKWSQFALSAMLVTSSVSYFFILCTLVKICTTDKRTYYTIIFCLCCMLINFSVIFELKVLARDVRRDIILMVGFVIAYTLVWLPIQVLLKSMVAKLIPPKIQSFSQGLIAGIMRLAMIIPAFTTPLLMPWIHIWALTLFVIVTINIMVFIMRRKSLANIRVISVNNNKL